MTAPTINPVVPPAAANPNGRKRFLDAAACRPVDRTPVWLMRQAGRALPEYRALKEHYTFVQLVQNPELAAEVTLQPIRRFGFDGAVLFSDILVVPEALGQKYQFREGGGIEMDFALETGSQIDALKPEIVNDGLQYVSRALGLIKSELAGRAALLGFAGSPWTLANFMMEGGSSKEFTKARALFQSNPALFNRLMEKLTASVTNFLGMQIDSGADAVQIFDSLGGSLAPEEFESASGSWMRDIVSVIGKRAPVIVFSRSPQHNWNSLLRTGAQVLGVDWTVSMTDVRNRVPANMALQGNLDPELLTKTPGEVAAETERILREMRGRPGHIFNLGHGVPPAAKLENIETLVHTVRNFS